MTSEEKRKLRERIVENLEHRFLGGVSHTRRQAWEEAINTTLELSGQDYQPEHEQDADTPEPALVEQPAQAPTPWTVAVEVVRKALMEVYANQFSMELIASASYAASEVLRLASSVPAEPKPAEFDARAEQEAFDKWNNTPPFDDIDDGTMSGCLRVGFKAGYAAGRATAPAVSEELEEIQEICLAAGIKEGSVLTVVGAVKELARRKLAVGQVSEEQVRNCLERAGFYNGEFGWLPKLVVELNTLPRYAVALSCIGYPDCDGDLEGEQHSEKCPLHSAPAPTEATLRYCSKHNVTHDIDKRCPQCVEPPASKDKEG